MYLDANGSLYDLPSLPSLRDPNEWANLKPLKTMTFSKKKKDALAASFLVHTTDPIHKAVTSVCGVHGAAVKAFKNLLGYCGDRKYQYPDTAIREIVKAGLEDTDGDGGLRSELYVQVMKQLRSNPSPPSVERGWEVMMLLLSCFPPPKELENYVHYFVRTNAPEETREKLGLAVHMSVHDGAKPSVPSDKDIPGILSAFFNREVTARYNIDEDVVTVRPPPNPNSAGHRAGWNIQAVGGDSGVGDTAVATSHAPAPVAAVAAVAAVARPLPAMPPPAAPALPPKHPQAKVLFAYDPAGQEGMIGLTAGETVSIKDSSDGDWWMAVDGAGTEGWVPANYVELL